MGNKKKWRPVHEICIEELTRPGGIILGDLICWTEIYIAGAIVPVEVIPDLIKVLDDAGKRVEKETDSVLGTLNAQKAIKVLEAQLKEMSGEDPTKKKDHVLQCTEKNCKGEVDLNTNVEVKARCNPDAKVFLCQKCGRLYFLEGDEVHKHLVGVFHWSGKKIFLIKNQIVNK